MTFFLIKLTKFEMKKVVIELKYTAIGKKKKTFETLISKAFSLINYLTSVKVKLYTYKAYFNRLYNYL